MVRVRIMGAAVLPALLLATATGAQTPSSPDPILTAIVVPKADAKSCINGLLSKYQAGQWRELQDEAIRFLASPKKFCRKTGAKGVDEPCPEGWEPSG